jgi:hypothetical protein
MLSIRAKPSSNAALLSELSAMAKKERLTLVYAARDGLHNEAVMLRDGSDPLTRGGRPASTTSSREARLEIGDQIGLRLQAD